MLPVICQRNSCLNHRPRHPKPAGPSLRHPGHPHPPPHRHRQTPPTQHRHRSGFARAVGHREIHGSRARYWWNARIAGAVGIQRCLRFMARTPFPGSGDGLGFGGFVNFRTLTPLSPAARIIDRPIATVEGNGDLRSRGLGLNLAVMKVCLNFGKL